MITKETADALAQVLLGQEQRQSDDRKNARARRSGLLYRFAELSDFQPWQREVITRRCAELVLREPMTVIVFAAWLLLVIALAFNLSARPFGISLGPVVVVCGLSLLLFHRWRVRRYVRAFLQFANEQRESSEDAH